MSAGKGYVEFVFLGGRAMTIDIFRCLSSYEMKRGWVQRVRSWPYFWCAACVALARLCVYCWYISQRVVKSSDTRGREAAKLFGIMEVIESWPSERRC